MASPTHVNQASTSAAFGSSRVLVMPSSPAPVTGQLLLAFVSGESALTSDTMSGWTKIDTANNGGGEYLSTYKRISDGADSGTVGGGGSATRQAWVTCTDDWDGVLANVGYAEATTSTLDPPSLNMGASRDHLFYAFARNNNNNITAAPSSYTFVASPITGGVVRLAVAYRQNTVQTENPGAFSGTTSAAVSGVIGVRPATFVTHQGAAALSADATLTSAGAPVRPGAAALSATATLTAAAAPIRPAAAELAADSTLTAAGTREVPAAATLSAEATLIAAGSSLAPGADLIATATLTATAVAIRVGATVSMVAEATLTVDTSSEQNATVDMVAESLLTAGATRVQQATAALAAESDLLAGTAALGLASATLSVTSSLQATAYVPTAKPIEFFDMACTITPPTGHFEPYPLLMGANGQPNDLRLMLVSASATGSGGASLDMPMSPDPPSGFDAPYILDQGGQTHGVYHRRLSTGDPTTYVAWKKPPNWRYFMWATLTARGVDPGTAPLAGKLTTAYNVKDPTALVSSVTVPAAGSMVLFLGTFPDPGGGVGGMSWASSLGVPQGWTPLVATDKSGVNYFPYDTNPSLIVIGKSFPAATTTGTLSIPVGSGAPAFFGMWCFLRPSPDVSITVGAA